MNVNSPVFIPHIIVAGGNLPITTNTLLVTIPTTPSLPNRWRRVDHTSPTSTMPLLINELDKLRQQQKHQESKQKQQKSKQKQQLPSTIQQKQYKNYIVTSNQLNYQYLLNNQSIESKSLKNHNLIKNNNSEKSFDNRTIKQELLLQHKVEFVSNHINNDSKSNQDKPIYKSQNIIDEEQKVPSETYDIQSDNLLLQNDNEFWQLPLKEQLLHQLNVHQEEASEQQRNQKEVMYHSLQEQFWQQLTQQSEYDDTVQHNSSNKVGHNNKNHDIPSTIINNQQQQQKFNATSKSNKSSGRTTTSATSAKRANYNKNNNKSHHHNHPWLASNLKGHTDEIRDIDFSSNGKFLASCAEDNNNTSNTTGDNHQQQHHENRHLHRGIIRHNNVHRNSTTSTSSTDSTADGSGSSDDINCSSSNEDISVHMYEPIILSNHKKSSKNGRNRQQRQRQRQLKIINTTSTTTTMEIDDELKENRNPLLQSSSSSSTTTTITANKILSSSSSSSTASSSVVATRKQYKNSSMISTSLATPLKSINSSLSSSSSKQQQNYHNNNNSSKISISTAEIEEIVNMNRRTTKSLLPSTLPLNIDETDLVKFLRYYVIDPNLLRIYGYPVESIYHDGSIEIFKCLSRPFTHYKTNGKFKKKCRSNNNNINNNNIELININNNKHVNIINENDGLLWSSRNLLSSSSDSSSSSSSSSSCMQISSGDSGQGDSGSSSPPSVIDSDTSEENGGDDDFTTTFYTPDGNYQIFNNYNQFGEKQCVRCNRNFILSENGKYLTKEECNYHWGRPYQVYISGQGITNFVNCCNREQNSFGCCNNYVHVWTGVTVGINGPFNDYVQTTKNYLKLNNCNEKKQQIINNLNIENLRKNKVYAIDCEMCFTATGLDVGKITIISIDGKLAYEQYIRPNMEIVDYNTRFSGITENDLSINNPNVKTLKQVQNELLQFINTDTILIGHALDNDLRALKILHKNVIDTSITFPHMSGFPYRRSLKHLTKNCLGRDIQTGEYGHCSFEDSQACLELILWRVQKDFELATTTTTTTEI